jgi:hypothetical protein
VTVLSIALFVRAYQNAGPRGGSHLGGVGPSLSSPTDRRAPSAAGTGTIAPADRAVVPGGPDYTLTAPGPRGFTILPPSKHLLVLSAHSALPIGEVGYLIPTSPNDSYGKAQNLGANWTMRTSVLGSPYYAALFIWAGATGAPVTCTIRLDGKVISSETTKGPYGRQVCVG